ncbi:MAG: PAT family beta-lactamase induction signal transducer AmpG [Myxococcota bacterium]|jgi:PAT family beta-lactamase induction signal transducer AmpG
MLLCLLLGFSSGLPLYVLIQLLPAWLRDAGVDLTTIGLMSLVSLPYTWKFLWAPLMDRLQPIPGLGRRRGWALLTQLALAAALAGLSLLDATDDISRIAALAAVVAFWSASQDIVLDAYRREILSDEELGLGNSLFVNAYRISSLVPGSLALILADQVPWSTVHLVVAGFMGVGLLTTLWMPEPALDAPPPRDFQSAVVAPFRAFFERGVKPAVLILLFMLLYKLGDSMATALATPFYLDLGFSKTDLGTVVKAASLWSSIFGGLVGGLLMVRIGINRALWIFGVVQMLSILGFAALSEIGPERWWLFAVVSFEYLGVGLGTAAFVAFIARSTDRRYTAAQLALLTSLTGLPRTFASSASGYLIENLGYTSFFLLCFALALPGMLMLPLVAPWNAKKS